MRLTYRASLAHYTLMLNRIALSCLLLSLVACAAHDSADDPPLPDDNGIGTSPSDPVQSGLKPDPVRPCGLWIADSPAAAEQRARLWPHNPDMAQYPEPGGLSCAALIAAQPAVEASYVGYSVVRYIP